MPISRALQNGVCCTQNMDDIHVTRGWHAYKRPDVIHATRGWHSRMCTLYVIDVGLVMLNGSFFLCFAVKICSCTSKYFFIRMVENKFYKLHQRISANKWFLLKIVLHFSCCRVFWTDYGSFA